MKKSIQSIIVSTLLLSSVAVADNVKSLIGFEGGYSVVDVSSNGTPTYDETSKLSHGGIKIGAESNTYRFFLGARYYDSKDFEKATTIGAELQYLLNFSDWGNFFFGVNAGQFDAEIKDPLSVKRKFTKFYYGGDAGINLHLGKKVDFEIGARIINMEATNTINNVTYTIDPIISAYGSLIFKFDLER